MGGLVGLLNKQRVMEGALNILQRHCPLAVSRCLWDRDVFSSIFDSNLSPLHFWSSYCRDKDDFIHMYNGILLGHKKEWNWVICREVDTPRVCHTEWRSQKEKKKYCFKYMLAYIWNPEEWLSWTYLQGRAVEVGTDIVDTGPVGVRWGELKGRIDTYTLPCVKWIASGKLVHSAGTSAGALWWPRWVGWGDLVIQQKLTQQCKAIILQIIIIMSLML